MSQCPSCDSLKTLHTSDEEIVCMGCAYVGPLDLCDSEDDPLESWKCSCCQEVYLVRNSTVCTNPECDLASESTQREREKIETLLEEGRALGDEVRSETDKLLDPSGVDVPTLREREKAT